RLFVAALRNNSVEVIDVARGKVIQSTREVKEPQGVKYMADLKLLAVASGEDGKCRIYDENLKLQRTIDDLDDADNVRYDEKAKLLYVGYGSGYLGVIEPKTGELVERIRVDVHPESFQLAT